MRCISPPAILLCSHHEINAGVASGNHVPWATATSKQEEMRQILQSQLPLLKCRPKFPGLPQPSLLHCSKAKWRCYWTGRVCTKIFWDQCCHIYSSNSRLRVLSIKSPYSCLGRSNTKEKWWHEYAFLEWEGRAERSLLSPQYPRGRSEITASIYSLIVQHKWTERIFGRGQVWLLDEPFKIRTASINVYRDPVTEHHLCLKLGNNLSLYKITAACTKISTFI